VELMQPFKAHTGICVALARADVDTDQIIPKQFLKRVERSGYGAYLFHDWRFDSAGAPVPDFVLNRPERTGATILVAGRNFGCGSSREHAAWALADYGFRCVIAPTFADIFRENADQNGLVAVELAEAQVGVLLARAGADARYRLSVSLETCHVTDGDGFTAPFEMDPFRRTCLLEGLDRIGLTLQHEDAIRRFEADRGGAYP
jgi:3-isopropylmalate/(R)-2-methylmalate dehydratase small subunit